jgi:hypothetical protein
MHFTDDLEGGDFKPFFDMAVGVLFIFLILIGSLLFFQTVDNTGAASAQNSVHEREMQIAAYLRGLADDLRARGLTAEIDLANAAIVLPLGQIATVGGDGLPKLQPQAANGLGEVLARDLACVAPAGDRSGGCAVFPLLRLDRAGGNVRIGEVAASLAPDRFGYLLAGELSSAMAEASPGLLGLSAGDGSMLWKIESAVGTGKAAGPGTVGGDFSIAFRFVP